MPDSGDIGSPRKVPDFRLPILGYHYVGAPPAGIARHLCVSTQEFEHQLDWLLSWGYSAVGADEVIGAFRGDTRLPGKSVMLTFDDGYAELETTAFPALCARGMTATVFLVSRRLGGRNDWDAVAGVPSVPLLGEESVRHWHARGIQFGAHTRTHRSLPDMSPEQRTDEIDGSKKDLAAVLGSPVESFAYPYGHTDNASAREVSRSFAIACSSWHGVNHASTEPWMLRRSMVSPGDSRFAFRCHLRFGRLPWRIALAHATPAKVVGALRRRGARW